MPNFYGKCQTVADLHEHEIIYLGTNLYAFSEIIGLEK